MSDDDISPRWRLAGFIVMLLAILTIYILYSSSIYLKDKPVGKKWSELRYGVRNKASEPLHKDEQAGMWREHIGEDANNKSLTPFIYLVQTETCISETLLSTKRLGDPKQCACEVIVLSYRSICKKHQHYQHVEYILGVNNTWARGRNHLYWAASKRNKFYLYYIYTDDDIFLTFTTHASKEMKSSVPMRVFEMFLLRYEPAIAVPTYFNKNAEWTNGKHDRICGRGKVKKLYYPAVDYDACFVAIHKDAAKHVLPYETKYDKHSWWNAGACFVVAAELKFRGQVVVYLPIFANNPGHRPYPHQKRFSDVEWSLCLEDEVKKMPRELRKSKLVRDFQRSPLHYLENAKTYCLDRPPHHKIISYDHFKTIR
ncbi:uncharacterized protein LOC116619754 [Nematostella vectensis]|uniref:uncharacterized protein LOC116619754 n=1 Tax=Nematostella vectensis TaxID=45351 RepID=UPI0020770BEF|nr:uncharacterized protein LOC116619754 [Nematostella vectensis]